MSTHGYRVVFVLSLWLGVGAVQLGFGGGLRTSVPKNTTVDGRIIAKVPIQGLTSYGLNYESYIFEVETGDKHTKQLIKFSYRFDQREPQLPKSFFDYSLIHKFRMRRDEDCDESWEGISNRLVFDSVGNFQGKQDALVYAKNASVPQLNPQLTLACYVATPRDYRATMKSVTKQSKPPIKTPGPAAEPATPDPGKSSKVVAQTIASTRKEE